MLKLNKLFAIFFLLLALSFASPMVVKADSGDNTNALLVSLGYNDNYYNGTIGIREGNIGFEYGYIFSPGWLKDLYDEYPNNDTHYKVLEKIEICQDIDVLGFIDPAEWFSLYGGIGVFERKYTAIVRAGADGLLYKRNTATDFNLAYSYGVLFKIDNALLGVGYHTIRGINLQIEARF